MKVEVTQYDLFLDFYLSRRGTGPMTITDWREGLAHIPDFWSDVDREDMLREGEEDRIRKWLKRVPKYDEHGEPIERFAAKRKDQKTGRPRDLWLEIPDMTYEDKVQVIEKHVDRSRYFHGEAVRLCRLFMSNSPAEERKRLKRRFQGLLELDFGAVTAGEVAR